jgi:O-antigen/teichoic acid export membrane protein
VVASAVAALYLLNLPALVLQTVSARYTSVAAGRNEAGGLPRLLLQVTALGLCAGLVLAGLLILFRGPLSAFLQITDQRVIPLLALASLVALVVGVTRGALQGFRRFVALSINTVLDMAVRVASAAGLILAGLGALGGVIALVLGPAVAYVESLLLFRGLRAQAVGERTPLGEVGRYAAISTIAAVGTTYLYNADVLLSKHYLSAEAAGIYAAASVLGRVVYFLGITIAQVMFPEVATLHARDEPHYHVVDLSLALLGAVAIGLTIFYAVLPGIVLLPYGAAFNPVRPYLWPFALALGLLSIINLFTNYLLSIGSARFAVPLIGACILETVLILRFHAGPAQIVEMVVLTMAALAAVLGAFYVIERAIPRPSPDA